MRAAPRLVVGLRDPAEFPLLREMSLDDLEKLAELACSALGRVYLDEHDENHFEKVQRLRRLGARDKLYELIVARFTTQMMTLLQCHVRVNLKVRPAHRTHKRRDKSTTLVRPFYSPPTISLVVDR